MGGEEEGEEDLEEDLQLLEDGEEDGARGQTRIGAQGGVRRGGARRRKAGRRASAGAMSGRGAAEGGSGGSKKAKMPFFSLSPKGRGGAAGEEDDDPEGSRHVRWDEATIAEHDKLRGTRQKIDEPDTPFHRDSFDSEADEDFEEDGDSAVKVVFEDGVKPGGATAPTSHAPTDMLDMDALQSQLDKAATADSDDARPAAAQKSAHDDFVSKRKQHYNEIEALRRWRQEHPDGDEDEDLDDDDEDA